MAAVTTAIEMAAVLLTIMSMVTEVQLGVY